MKAISYSEYGGADVLEYGERPDPTVGPGSVLVKVRAAAVNPVDRKAREGYLDSVLDAVFPMIPGWEQGIVTVHTDRPFPLERAADAYRLNEEGRTRGKTVVTVDRDS